MELFSTRLLNDIIIRKSHNQEPQFYLVMRELPESMSIEGVYDELHKHSAFMIAQKLQGMVFTGPINNNLSGLQRLQAFYIEIAEDGEVVKNVPCESPDFEWVDKSHYAEVVASMDIGQIGKPIMIRLNVFSMDSTEASGYAWNLLNDFKAKTKISQIKID